LFGREFHIEETLTLWDALFVDAFQLGRSPQAPSGGGLPDIAAYVAVAMLVSIRSELLAGDYFTVLQNLMKYPDSPGGAQLLVHRALGLRMTLAAAPSDSATAASAQSASSAATAATAATAAIAATAATAATAAASGHKSDSLASRAPVPSRQGPLPRQVKPPPARARGTPTAQNVPNEAQSSRLASVASSHDAAAERPSSNATPNSVATSPESKSAGASSRPASPSPFVAFFEELGGKIDAMFDADSGSSPVRAALPSADVASLARENACLLQVQQRVGEHLSGVVSRIASIATGMQSRAEPTSSEARDAEELLKLVREAQNVRDVLLGQLKFKEGEPVPNPLD